MNAELKAAALSYFRAALSSAAALLISGITDPKILINALLAGLLAPVLRAANPKDNAYGLGSK
jgi:hypothetical protein